MPRHFGLIPREVRHAPIRSYDNTIGLTLAIVVLVLAYVLIPIVVVSMIVKQSHGRELYPGQYAQVDPALRYWFRNQTSPKNGQNCCSEADGIFAEEDIRKGHYWTRFTARRQDGSEMDSGWLQVPDDVVIHDPNRNGAPVAWYFYEYVGELVQLRIRCFAPGGGV